MWLFCMSLINCKYLLVIKENERKRILGNILCNFYSATHSTDAVSGVVQCSSVLNAGVHEKAGAGHAGVVCSSAE